MHSVGILGAIGMRETGETLMFQFIFVIFLFDVRMEDRRSESDEICDNQKGLKVE